MKRNFGSLLRRLVSACAVAAIVLATAIGPTASAEAREVPGAVSVMVLPQEVVHVPAPTAESECNSKTDMLPPSEDCTWDWHTYIHFGYP